MKQSNNEEINKIEKHKMQSEADNNNINKAIIKTLAFFDLFDYPLTPWEVYKFLYKKPAKYFDVIIALSNLVQNKKIETKNSFYFLPGKTEIYNVRKERYLIANKKYKIARRAARWLSWLTHLKMIAVCNNLAYSNSKNDSDIDVFIITAKNKIWLTRLLITLILQLAGLRRHGLNIKDKICLSFYLTEDNLKLQNIALNPDPYFYYWFLTLTPIFDGNIYFEFWRNNNWLKFYTPNAFPKIINSHRGIKNSKFKNYDKKINQKFDKMLMWRIEGGRLEKLAKIIQLKKMSANRSSVASQNDTRVIISDTILKFHEQDRRAEYRDQWLEKLNSL